MHAGIYNLIYFLSLSIKQYFKTRDSVEIDKISQNEDSSDMDLNLEELMLKHQKELQKYNTIKIQNI